jgi:hypothetical protein
VRIAIGWVIERFPVFGRRKADPELPLVHIGGPKVAYSRASTTIDAVQIVDKI